MDRIIDIRTVNFEDWDRSTIAVDTNVLLFLFYDRITYVNQESHISLKKAAYQEFFEEVAKYNTKIKLITTVINLNEAFHIIEQTEYEIYCARKSGFIISLKDFRKLPDERKKVKREYKAFWQQICRYLSVFEYTMTKNFIKDFYVNCDKFRYDCLDAALVECCINNKINNILTDDSDFFGYDIGIDILTANIKSI